MREGEVKEDSWVWGSQCLLLRRGGLGDSGGGQGAGAGRSWGSASKCQVEDAYSVCTLISAVPAPLKYKILNSQRKNMKSFLFMKTKYKITINCHPK